MGLLILIACAIAAGFWIVGRRRKLSWIQQHRPVYVQGAAIRYADLPLQGFGIPLRLKDSASARPSHRAFEQGELVPLIVSDRVEVVFPRLTAEGDVEYIYSWHDLQDMTIATATPEGTTAQQQVIQDIAPIILEHLDLEREIEQLDWQYDRLSQLADRVASSTFYRDQLQLYERGLDQVSDLLTQAEELRSIYVRLLRETLIGMEIANYDPSSLPAEMDQINRRYARWRSKFDQLREDVQGYLDVANDRP